MKMFDDILMDLHGVCVTKKHVWKRIFKDLRPNDKDTKQMDEYTLQGNLFQLLETSRYFVVLDVVWKKCFAGLKMPTYFPQ